MAINSDNVDVRTLTKTSILWVHSVIGRLLKVIASIFNMEESNVYKVWTGKCDNENDADKLSVHVRE